MSYIDKVINYQKKCPECNNDLIYILRGFPRKENVKKLEKAGIKFVLGGCVINGDDRDSDYLCEKCRKEFSSELKEIDKKYYTFY